MIKKIIRFKDFDDNDAVEEHYFHLSKMELMDMEFSTEGGMADKLQKIMNSGKASEIMDTFKKIIADSYGIRESNTKFTKDPAVTAAFMTSPAFDAFYEELLISPSAAAEFVNGVMPKDLAAQVDMEKIFKDSAIDSGVTLALPGAYNNQPILAQTGLKNPYTSNGDLLPWALRAPTKHELQGMQSDQLRDAMLRMNAGWTPPPMARPGQ